MHDKGTERSLEMGKFRIRAEELRRQETPHINCAQATVLPFSEALGIPDELAMRFAGGFGGGMKRGSVCGAVTGGIMALSLFGLDDPKTLGAYHRAIREAHGGMLDCAELLKAAFEAGLEKKPHCDAMIYTCVDLVEEILRSEGKLPEENNQKAVTRA